MNDYGVLVLTHHVRVLHRSEQHLADGDGAEDVARREGRVQEEPDVGGAVAAEQEGGEEEQVVVVRPDLGGHQRSITNEPAAAAARW